MARNKRPESVKEEGERSRPGAALVAVHERLNRIPMRRAVALGLGVGIAGGLAATGSGVAGLLAVTALAGVALLAGWDAQPVWVAEPPPPPPDLFDMVAIEGGTFRMGSPRGEEGRGPHERRYRVRVYDFHIGATVVTRQQYREVMGLDEAPGPGGADHPVTEVSWLDAVEFCNRASEQAGFEPCYVVDGDDVTWKKEADGYRLPTEAEWEYAARAGSQARWFFGDDEEQLGEHAWYAGNSNLELHPVAGLVPNPWGLYDVHGNVWERCWDFYSADPPRSRWFAVRDPSVDRMTTSSAFRVLRGGAFDSEPWYLRSANRNRYEPEDRYRLVGFRCVRAAQLDPLPFDPSDSDSFARSAKSRQSHSVILSTKTSAEEHQAPVGRDAPGPALRRRALQGAQTLAHTLLQLAAWNDAAPSCRAGWRLRRG